MKAKTLLMTLATVYATALGCNDPGESESQLSTNPEDYADQEGTPVTFRVHNDSPVDVYIETWCKLPSYQILPYGGGDFVHFETTVTDECLLTCEELQGPTQFPGNCDDCAPGELRVPAGDTVDIVWDALTLPWVEMPEELWHNGAGASKCVQKTAVPSGDFTIVVVATNLCHGTDCDCAGADLCFGEATEQRVETTPVAFALPSAGVVDVVFDACAFGCP